MKETLVLYDPVYGMCEFAHPVFSALVGLDEIQRLKKIDQLGVPHQYFHKEIISRYQHSLGTAKLIQMMDGSDEEQVAALLHDVSHTAFSHVYDRVITDQCQGDFPEDYQDNRHANFINKSSIPQVLLDFGFDPQRITNLQNFPLLDREIPDLCADRIDYALRQSPISFSRYILDKLKVVDEQIVCQTRDAASFLGRAFLKLQQEGWGSYESVARYHHFAAVLKRGLEIGIIFHQDFELDDLYITGKLEQSDDEYIKNTLQALKQPKIMRPKESIAVRKKFRYIDPPFVDGTKIHRLSDVDENFKFLIEEAKKENEQGILVPEALAR